MIERGRMMGWIGKLVLPWLVLMNRRLLVHYQEEQEVQMA